MRGLPRCQVARRTTLAVLAICAASPVAAGVFVYLATARLVGLTEPYELLKRQR